MKSVDQNEQTHTRVSDYSSPERSSLVGCSLFKADENKALLYSWSPLNLYEIKESFLCETSECADRYADKIYNH